MISAAVDSDVTSYVFKRDSRAAQYQPLLENRLLIVSYMSIAELERWAIVRHWGESRRAELARFLDQFVLPPMDRELCLAWAHVTEEAGQAGYTINCADAWVAATAVRYQIPLITHNPDDFRGVSQLTVLTGNE